MSETLLPCPFCSAEPEILSDWRRTWGLVQHNEDCLFPVYPKHEISESDFAAWNTRATSGTLTAEQVEIAINNHCQFTVGCVVDAQAIADELNAKLESGKAVKR